MSEEAVVTMVEAVSSDPPSIELTSDDGSVFVELQALMTGPPGPTADITINVTTTDAGTQPLVVKTGTEAAPVFNLELPAASQKTTLYDFANAAIEWDITHNLGRHPSVTIVDTAGDVGFADVRYLDANRIVVGFSVPVAGTAFLN